MNWKKYAPIPYWMGILIALGFAALFTLKSYVTFVHYYAEMEQKETFQLWRILSIHTVNFVTWALLLPLLNYWVERYPIQSPSWRVKGIALLLCLGTSFFHEFFSSFMYAIPAKMMGLYPIGEDIMEYIIRGLRVAVPNRILEYGVIYAILTGVQMQKKFRSKELELAQVESQLSNARLSALRLQLQPHFLFNTLNTISSLMEINVNSAQKVVSRLGGLLRYVLDREERNCIPLREELEFVRNYLDIEQTRFHDRLTINYEIDPAASDIWVPHLILQPLVENAIKHGFSRRSGDGRIDVIARLAGENVELLIRDDGEGSDQSETELLQGGIGLSNVKKRLELLYGGEADLKIETHPGKGFSVSIVIPMQKTDR
ncbi:MAG: histidine kinase [Saprospiraceae bacterium]|nr:histidine kinase [Lewinella sp.]